MFTCKYLSLDLIGFFFYKYVFRVLFYFIRVRFRSVGENDFVLSLSKATSSDEQGFSVQLRAGRRKNHTVAL